jgi:hypothetical protein
MSGGPMRMPGVRCNPSLPLLDAESAVGMSSGE